MSWRSYTGDRPLTGSTVNGNTNTTNVKVRKRKFPLDSTITFRGVTGGLRSEIYWQTCQGRYSSALTELARLSTQKSEISSLEFSGCLANLLSLCVEFAWYTGFNRDNSTSSGFKNVLCVTPLLLDWLSSFPLTPDATPSVWSSPPKVTRDKRQSGDDNEVRDEKQGAEDNKYVEKKQWGDWVWDSTLAYVERNRQSLPAQSFSESSTLKADWYNLLYLVYRNVVLHLWPVAKKLITQSKEIASVGSGHVTESIETTVPQNICNDLLQILHRMALDVLILHDMWSKESQEDGTEKDLRMIRISIEISLACGDIWTSRLLLTAHDTDFQSLGRNYATARLTLWEQLSELEKGGISLSTELSRTTIESDEEMEKSPTKIKELEWGIFPTNTTIHSSLGSCISRMGGLLSRFKECSQKGDPMFSLLHVFGVKDSGSRVSYGKTLHNAVNYVLSYKTLSNTTDTKPADNPKPQVTSSNSTEGFGDHNIVDKDASNNVSSVRQSLRARTSSSSVDANSSGTNTRPSLGMQLNDSLKDLDWQGLQVLRESILNELKTDPSSTLTLEDATINEDPVSQETAANNTDASNHLLEFEKSHYSLLERLVEELKSSMKTVLSCCKSSTNSTKSDTISMSILTEVLLLRSILSSIAWIQYVIFVMGDTPIMNIACEEWPVEYVLDVTLMSWFRLETLMSTTGENLMELDVVKEWWSPMTRWLVTLLVSECCAIVSLSRLESGNTQAKKRRSSTIPYRNVLANVTATYGNLHTILQNEFATSPIDDSRSSIPMDISDRSDDMLPAPLDDSELIRCRALCLLLRTQRLLWRFSIDGESMTSDTILAERSKEDRKYFQLISKDTQQHYTQFIGKIFEKVNKTWQFQEKSWNLTHLAPHSFASISASILVDNSESISDSYSPNTSLGENSLLKEFSTDISSSNYKVSEKNSYHALPSYISILESSSNTEFVGTILALVPSPTSNLWTDVGKQLKITPEDSLRSNLTRLFTLLSNQQWMSLCDSKREEKPRFQEFLSSNSSFENLADVASEALVCVMRTLAEGLSSHPFFTTKNGDDSESSISSKNFADCGLESHQDLFASIVKLFKQVCHISNGSCLLQFVQYMMSFLSSVLRLYPISSTDTSALEILYTSLGGEVLRRWLDVVNELVNNSPNHQNSDNDGVLGDNFAVISTERFHRLEGYNRVLLLLFVYLPAMRVLPSSDSPYFKDGTLSIDAAALLVCGLHDILNSWPEKEFTTWQTNHGGSTFCTLFITALRKIYADSPRQKIAILRVAHFTDAFVGLHFLDSMEVKKTAPNNKNSRSKKESVMMESNGVLDLFHVLVPLLFEVIIDSERLIKEHLMFVNSSDDGMEIVVDPSDEKDEDNEEVKKVFLACQITLFRYFNIIFNLNQTCLDTIHINAGYCGAPPTVMPVRFVALLPFHQPQAPPSDCDTSASECLPYDSSSPLAPVMDINQITQIYRLIREAEASKIILRRRIKSTTLLSLILQHVAPAIFEYKGLSASQATISRLCTNYLLDFAPFTKRSTVHGSTLLKRVEDIINSPQDPLTDIQLLATSALFNFKDDILNSPEILLHFFDSVIHLSPSTYSLSQLSLNTLDTLMKSDNISSEISFKDSFFTVDYMDVNIYPEVQQLLLCVSDLFLNPGRFLSSRVLIEILFDLQLKISSEVEKSIHLIPLFFLIRPLLYRYLLCIASHSDSAISFLAKNPLGLLITFSTPKWYGANIYLVYNFWRFLAQSCTANPISWNYMGEVSDEGGFMRKIHQTTSQQIAEAGGFVAPMNFEFKELSAEIDLQTPSHLSALMFCEDILFHSSNFMNYSTSGSLTTEVNRKFYDMSFKELRKTTHTLLRGKLFGILQWVLLKHLCENLSHRSFAITEPLLQDSKDSQFTRLNLDPCADLFHSKKTMKSNGKVSQPIEILDYYGVILVSLDLENELSPMELAQSTTTTAIEEQNDRRMSFEGVLDLSSNSNPSFHSENSTNRKCDNWQAYIPEIILRVYSSNNFLEDSIFAYVTTARYKARNASLGSTESLSAQQIATKPVILEFQKYKSIPLPSTEGFVISTSNIDIDNSVQSVRSPSLSQDNPVSENGPESPVIKTEYFAKHIKATKGTLGFVLLTDVYTIRLKLAVRYLNSHLTPPNCTADLDWLISSDPLLQQWYNTAVDKSSPTNIFSTDLETESNSFPSSQCSIVSLKAWLLALHCIQNMFILYKELHTPEKPKQFVRILDYLSDAMMELHLLIPHTLPSYLSTDVDLEEKNHPTVKRTIQMGLEMLQLNNKSDCFDLMQFAILCIYELIGFDTGNKSITPTPVMSLDMDLVFLQKAKATEWYDLMRNDFVYRSIQVQIVNRIRKCLFELNDLSRIYDILVYLTSNELNPALLLATKDVFETYLQMINALFSPSLSLDSSKKQLERLLYMGKILFENCIERNLLMFYQPFLQVYALRVLTHTVNLFQKHPEIFSLTSDVYEMISPIISSEEVIESSSLKTLLELLNRVTKDIFPVSVSRKRPHPNDNEIEDSLQSGPVVSPHHI